MSRDNIQVNDRQLACARIHSQEGQDYLVRSSLDESACSLLNLTAQSAMACAANYAWVNRSSMTFLCRQACSTHRLRGPIRALTFFPGVCEDVQQYP